MSIPEKRELIDEIESLPQTYYEEVLDFMQFLKQKKQQHVSPPQQKQPNPLLQFAGALADTDLTAPDDPLPEPVDPF